MNSKEAINFVDRNAYKSNTILNAIKKIWRCKIWKHHNWTSAHQKGIDPNEMQLKSIQGFYDYAKMYCDDCGHESKYNLK